MKYKIIPTTYMEDSEDTRKENPQIKYQKMYEEEYVKDMLKLVKDLSDTLHSAINDCSNRGTQRAAIPIIIKAHKTLKNHK